MLAANDQHSEGKLLRGGVQLDNSSGNDCGVAA